MMVTYTDFDDFETYYDEAKVKIDQRLKEIFADEDFTSKRALFEHATRGGKRLRPVLTLLVSDVFDVPRDTALTHAAIVELIHTASLVSDDAYDEDATRRGAPALWKVIERLPFGKRTHKAISGLTVMGSNGLAALAFQLAEDPDVLKAMGKGINRVLDGFIMEAGNVFTGTIGGGYDKYIEISRLKTGGLFSLAAWVAPSYTDAPEEQTEAARKYGEQTGILFQLSDDLVDDDLPSFVEDPAEELEKWYDKATGHIEDLPVEDEEIEQHLHTAPAYMVYRMLEEGDALGSIDVGFIPEPEAE